MSKIRRHGEEKFHLEQINDTGCLSHTPSVPKRKSTIWMYHEGGHGNVRSQQLGLQSWVVGR